MMPGGGYLFRNLLRFGRLLRELGLEVQAGRMLDVAHALADVGVRRRSDVRHALRTLLVHRQEDLARFDEAFELFFRPHTQARPERPLRALGERRGPAPLAEASLAMARRDGPLDFAPKRPLADAPVESRKTSRAAQRAFFDPIQTYSPVESWRLKDFARFTPEEIAGARALLAGFRWDLGTRLTRRWLAGRGRTPDLRRLVRRNMKYGGELVEVPRRRRAERPRPLVVICDVSGSMERYSRMLLHFVHALARSRGRVEAFVFATRLTRITGHLRRGSLDGALRAIPRAVLDWAGGTRIGEALRALNLHWARRVLGHGPVVLLISDGWDRGDPPLLRREVARLQRSCHRLIWLNPLLGSPAYEPLTRGMQAALPFVDDFLPAHNLASLEALAAHLSALPPQRPARRQVVAPRAGVDGVDVAPAPG